MLRQFVTVLAALALILALPQAGMASGAADRAADCASIAPTLLRIQQDFLSSAASAHNAGDSAIHLHVNSRHNDFLHVDDQLRATHIDVQDGLNNVSYAGVLISNMKSSPGLATAASALAQSYSQGFESIETFAQLAVDHERALNAKFVNSKFTGLYVLASLFSRQAYALVGSLALSNVTGQRQSASDSAEQALRENYGSVDAAFRATWQPRTSMAALCPAAISGDTTLLPPYLQALP